MYAFEAYNPTTKKTANIGFSTLKDAFMLLTSAELPAGWTFTFTTPTTQTAAPTKATRGKAKVVTAPKRPRGRPKGYSPKKAHHPVAMIDQLNGSGQN